MPASLRGKSKIFMCWSLYVHIEVDLSKKVNVCTRKVGKDRQLSFVELKLCEISEISQKNIEYQFDPVVRMLWFVPT